MIYDPNRIARLKENNSADFSLEEVRSNLLASDAQLYCDSQKSAQMSMKPSLTSDLEKVSQTNRERLEQQRCAAIGLLSGSVTATPSLCIDRTTLRSNLATWQTQLPLVQAFFAVKANCDPLVLQELFANGANADVASAHEIEVVRAVGLSGDRMILSNPRKDIATIYSMKAVKVWATTVDSSAEIDKLVEAGIPSGDYNPVLFFRIKVPTSGVTQNLNTKFGIRVLPTTIQNSHACGHLSVEIEELPFDFENLRNMLNRALRAGFSQFGLAFHVGTQCTDPRVYEFAVGAVQRLAETFRSEGLPVNHLDIGGGFPDERIARQKNPKSLHDPRVALLRAVGRAAEQAVAAGFQVIAEPGRYLVADAGFLVTAVTYIEPSESTIQIDDGIFRTLSGRIHDDRDYAFHLVRPDEHSGPDLSDSSPMTIWGCSCDSFDMVSDRALVPSDIEMGDILLVEGMGAYSTSFSSNTNGFGPAKVVLYHFDTDNILHHSVSPMGEQNELLARHLNNWVKGE